MLQSSKNSAQSVNQTARISRRPRQRTKPVIWFSQDEWIELVRNLSGKVRPIEAMTAQLTYQSLRWQAWISLDEADSQCVLINLKKSKRSEYILRVYQDDLYQACLLEGSIKHNTLSVTQVKGNEAISRDSLKKIIVHFNFVLNQPFKASADNIAPPPGSKESSEEQNQSSVNTQKRPQAIEKAQTRLEETPWYTSLGDLLAHSAPHRQDASFAQKFKALTQAMFSESETVHRAWFDLGQTSLLLDVSHSQNYYSNTLPQDITVPEMPQQENSWYVFHLFREGALEDNDICMQLRISLDGSFSELVYIKAVEHIRGNDLLALSHKLIDWLGIKNTILLDDAHDAQNIPLRIVKPIAEGVCWYKKNGYDIYPCQDLPVTEDRVKITQSPKIYQESIAIARKKSLKELLAVQLKKFKGKFGDLLKRYPAHEENLGSMTSKVLEACKSAEPKTQKQGQKDLLFLYKSTMDPEYLRKRSWYCPNIKDYTDAINTLNTYQVKLRSNAKPC